MEEERQSWDTLSHHFLCLVLTEDERQSGDRHWAFTATGHTDETLTAEQLPFAQPHPGYHRPASSCCWQRWWLWRLPLLFLWKSRGESLNHDLHVASGQHHCATEYPICLLFHNNNKENPKRKCFTVKLSSNPNWRLPKTGCGLEHLELVKGDPQALLIAMEWKKWDTSFSTGFLSVC